MLLAKKVTIPLEYANFANLFSKKLTKMLPKQIDINKYAIKLVNSKQPSNKSIYNLKSIKFKTLKIYITTNLVNRLIYLLKFFADTFTFFDWKLNNSFRLYLNYQSLNNLIIKNCYLLLLINKSLDCLE